jgi:hypothetical protein
MLGEVARIWEEEADFVRLNSLEAAPEPGKVLQIWVESIRLFGRHGMLLRRVSVAHSKDSHCVISCFWKKRGRKIIHST